MMRRCDLQGRTALVTGGNGGIGLGMARGLAEAGAAVVLAGRNADKGERACRELEAIGANATFVAGDVTDEGACRALVDKAAERLGRLDILVNNAGAANRKRPENYTLAEWNSLLQTNLTSAFVCSQAVYPHMVAAGGGKIINIGSMMSIFGAEFAAPYAATKGGIVQLTRALATAWARDNIQVNAVLPGWIDTDMTRTARRQIEGLYERVLARTPAGRWGEPDDFAGIAAFLATRASDFVTGTAIPVDGGYSVQA